MRGMNMVDEAKEKLLRWVTPVVIALLGGLARQAKDHRDGVEFSWWGFLSRLVIAAFAGLLAMLMCLEYGLSDQMTGTVAGVAGYSGVEAIECIKRFVSGRYRGP